MMAVTQVNPSGRVKHAEFQMAYIWAALALAIFVGFAIGAHLAAVIGYDFDLGDGFLSFIQIHGHVQLVGWVGLFIIGISLYFLPRLAGVPLLRSQWQPRILWLIVSGLILRSVGHSILPYVSGALFFAVSRMVVASATLEWFGIAIYVVSVVATVRRVENLEKRPALVSVKPFLLMMLAGWITYASLNLVTLVQMVLSRAVVADQGWNEFAIQVFIGLVLLPVAFAFSVRTFPLYLRLRPPDWPVRAIAWVYLLALVIQLLPMLPPVLSLSSRFALAVSGVGMILRGVVILWFVWELDVLFRRKQPWTVNRIFQPGPERRPTRPGLPDYGEFGRFERLVYSAYVWLAIGAFFEIVSGVSLLVNRPFIHVADAVRHIYLLGFVTNLILGVAVRMVPGFIHKRKVARPRLVAATFWLGNAAAVGRVLPMLLPPTLFVVLPVSMHFAQTAFAFSGITAMAAISCLTINLWRTARAE